MVIVTYCYGDNNDRNISLISNWLSNYQKSKTKIPAILLYDEYVDKQILKLWPYEAILLPQYINIELTEKNDIFVKQLKSNIIKMLSYSLVGKCIVMDCDTVIQKEIKYEMIPYCTWGLIRQDSIPDFTIFEEFRNVECCATSVQIFNDNYYELFKILFIKYLKLMHKLSSIELYGASIVSLTHKLSNGTFIQPEWAWDYEIPYVNRQAIIKQYHSNKYMFINSQFHIPDIGIIAK